jgi:drug/metabolite transporter (DMT)-like permease
MKKPSKNMADLGLLSVTVFWGTTFILSKQVLEHISLLNYLGIRLGLAAFFMFLFTLGRLKHINAQTSRDGIILGILLFFSYLFQMWGIQFTSASNAGFITGLNVILVPVFSVLLFKDKPRLASLIGVVFATTGLFFLSGGDFTALSKGDWLVLICAVVVTFHVIFTGRFAVRNDIYLLTFVQLTTVALLALSLLFFERQPLQAIPLNCYLILIYLALFGTVYTFFMQTAMQRFTTATRTALVFSMEPVFAALFAYMLAGETMGTLGWLGGGLILAGMIIAEIKWEQTNTRL